MFKNFVIVDLIMFVDLLIVFFMLNNSAIFVTKITLLSTLKINILTIVSPKTILLNKITMYDNNEFCDYLIAIAKTYLNL